MLVMKAWMETRWRLSAVLFYSLIALAINYKGQSAPAAKPGGMLTLLLMVLATFVMPLAGSGVQSQSPAGFPEGLAGSTQFTISLPVSRPRLLAVRAAIGWLEASAVTLLVAGLTWSLFPSIRATIAPADFARGVLTTLLFLTVPYCTHVFFSALIDELPALMFSGCTFSLLLWLLHHVTPAVDIVRAVTQSSPLVTHQLPWSQMATSAGLALILMWAAVRAVQTREY
jgi:hypothetical protein